MITCLGLVVGAVKSCVRQFVLQECAEHIKRYHLEHVENLQFEIDGTVYCTVQDTHNFDDGQFGVLFELYNGMTDVVMI